MIKLENVNKYFYRHKKNELHVIDNVSIDLPNKGLVSLLGPSGCGKTTLLNAISGLDNIHSGKIYVNNERISKRRVSKIDKIRNINIGYIFQDYNLIDTMSVFENVALSLKLIGIKDKKEIQKRVNYVLQKVGMYRYRNRYANMLSGGERQRVAIARAIVKNPNIIIADEPTGNLDSANTIEIMNIISSIAKEKLVILVTHEKELAKFYSTRILEIEDGKIVNDIDNKDVEELDYKISNNIYLKDFNVQKTIKTDNINVNIYSEEEVNIDFNIIVRNGNIFISGNDNIDILKSDSKIKVIDDSYKKLSRKETDEYNFKYDELGQINPKYSSIFNIFTLLKRGFAKVRDYTFAKKLLLIGFFASAIFITYSISSMFGVNNVEDKDFVLYNKDYLQVKLQELNIKDFLKIEQDENINYVLPGNSIVYFNIQNKDYYQTFYYAGFLSGSLSSINMINKDDIIEGRMPENNKEIVMDIEVVKDFLLSNNDNKGAGFIDEHKLLNKEVTIKNTDKYTIVGYVSLNSPSIYTYESEFTNIIANNIEYYYYDGSDDSMETPIRDYELFKDDIKIVKGKLPKNDYEVILNENEIFNYELNKNSDIKINNKKLKVVGFYRVVNKENFNYSLTNNNMIKYNNILTKSNLTIYAKDKEKALNTYSEKYDIKEAYEFAKEKYLKDKKDALYGTYIFSIVILIISLIEIYLMVRSSFLSRLKEVGIYRAIGVKKKDIYKMFMGEIIAVTTLASVPGMLIMSYALHELSFISTISNKFLMNGYVMGIIILFIYTFNIIVGLLPVMLTLRSTPAKILSRTDI